MIHRTRDDAFPIIYVRGYAGTQQEIEETVDDPFYGFNAGATHVRVGPQGRAQFFAFESPLVRLMKDHGYRDTFGNGVEGIISERYAEPRRSIWLYRYYDSTSKTFDAWKGERLTIEDAAANLRNLIIEIKRQTEARKVILIAHSMGGLICRSLIQKIYPEEAALSLRDGINPVQAIDDVECLVTFGTPHGGIHFDLGGGTLDRLRDLFGWNNSNDFGPDRMYAYLTPGVEPDSKAPPDFDPSSIGTSFPADRILCLIGTNARDYEVFGGLSRVAVGPQSDGLVQIQHAYVKGSHRAYVHRSHSGRYGIVNSEEGYQNVQRFLFGDLQIKISLNNVQLVDDPSTFYLADVQVAIRNLPILMHEQTVNHFCPIRLDRLEPDGKNVRRNHPLFTTFLIPRYSAVHVDQEGHTVSRYSLQIAVYRFRQSSTGRFSFQDHLERVPLWNDYLIFDAQTSTDAAIHSYDAHYVWLSEAHDPRNPEPSLKMEFGLPAIKEDQDADGHAIRVEGVAEEIELPARARDIMGEGAVLRFETYAWRGLLPPLLSLAESRALANNIGHG